jgi:anti-sigma-K factor RskA
MSDHDRWADAAGAYLLHALEEDEKSRYEAHLERCHLCQDEIEFLRVASDALPASVEQFAAPPELKDRIMTIVNREAELLRAAGPEADRPPLPAPAPGHGRRWWQLVPRSALALGATVLLIAGGVTGWTMRDGGVDEAPVVARTVPADVLVADGTASLIVREDHSTLVTKKMPRPGNDRVYQVWLQRKGVAKPEPTNALFTVRHDGSASVDVPGSLDDVEAVLVTAEPEGGSQAPTSKPVIKAVPA